jgi:hypothetical protein
VASGGLAKIFCAAKLLYIELQYWLIGLSPEGYHDQKAAAFARLPDYPRAIAQLRASLGYSESANNRLCIAYYYVCLDDWVNAAVEYAQAAKLKPTPEILLAQAEAELRLGHTQKGVELIATAEVIVPAGKPELARAAADLRREFGLPT